MAQFNTFSKNTFDILINGQEATGYLSNSGDLLISVSLIGESVADSTLKTETNYVISTDPLNPTGTLVPATLTATFSESGLTAGKRLGFRITMAADANTDFKFSTTNDTLFSTAAKNPVSLYSGTIADGDSGNFIWATADTIAGTSTISLPINLNYEGTTNGTKITFGLQIVEGTYADSSATGISEIAYVLQTTGDVPRSLEAEVFSAEITSTATSHDPATLTNSKTSFLRNDVIVLKTLLDTNTGVNYKSASAFRFITTVNKAVTLATLYVSALADAASETALTDDIALGDSSVTVSYPLTDNTETLAGNGIVIADSADTKSNVITVTMPTGDKYAKLFENGTLKDNVYVYIKGSINGLPQ